MIKKLKVVNPRLYAFKIAERDIYLPKAIRDKFKVVKDENGRNTIVRIDGEQK